jgi:hypothetical protein
MKRYDRGSIPMDLETKHGMGTPGWQAQETQLLLSVLDRAVSRIALATSCQDPERASQYLSQALDSYGSVKGLLPKLGLTADQVTLVRERLETVRRLLPTA